jgi:hypothetical protein
MVLAFNRVWRYIMLGNLTSSRIVYPWATTPIFRNVSLSFNPYAKYTSINTGQYGTWPWPSEDWTIVFVDGAQLPTVRNPVYAFAVPKRITVAIWPRDTNETIGNRIWHEIIHAQGIDADLLGPNQPAPYVSDFPAFVQYVKSTPPWNTNTEIQYWIAHPYANPYESNTISRAYYTMLWKRAGFPIG